MTSADAASRYRTENPATGEVLETFETLDDAGVRAAIEGAEAAYRTWRAAPVEERAGVLSRTAALYEEHADELARIIATEMGKPLKQGVGEVRLGAAIYAYYAEQAEALLAPEPMDSKGAQQTMVEREPIGVVLGIMPWNFPYYQVARFAAPALLLGNTVLLKHAPICARSALRMGELLAEAGVPEGVYTTIFADNDQVADIIADPRVQGVSLTGSERAGAAVAETAGRHLKKSVLELGGSDAMIVLDGDVTRIAKVAARQRLMNAGQACTSPKRIIVLDSVHDEFVAALTAAVEQTVVGDPADPATHMGPLSSTPARDGVVDQVADALAKGATVHTGGTARDGAGAFMEPTVLSGITPEMRAWREELFGPVAMVFKVAGVDEAVALANDSDYGLSGSVWSDDTDLALETARRLDVGMAFVNEHGTTLPGLPFGGVKRSGFGRELGHYGLDEFANRRLVRVARRH